MGASSVTGVSGQYGAGAAYGQKGPGNKRDQFVPLSAPHVVASGTTVSVTGSSNLVVTLPTPLPLAPAKYSIILTANAATYGYVTAANDVAGGTTYGLAKFTINNNTATAATFNYLIVTNGSNLDVNETARDAGATTTYPSGTTGAYPVQS